MKDLEKQGAIVNFAAALYSTDILNIRKGTLLSLLLLIKDNLPFN